MKPDKIDTNECMCCICYEEDIYYSMIHCNICVEGNICLECYDNNEFIDNNYCPICKNILVSESIRKIVCNIMNYYADDYCKDKFHYNLLSPLIKRFVKNYMKTDFYLTHFKNSYVIN